MQCKPNRAFSIGCDRVFKLHHLGRERTRQILSAFRQISIHIQAMDEGAGIAAGPLQDSAQAY